MNSPRRRSSRFRWIVFAAIAFSVSACGESSEEDRVPVYQTSGKITFEGKPLSGVLVLFRKAEVDSKIPSPTGTTGEDGTFTLHTYEPDDGAPMGDYLVAVSVKAVNRDGGGGMFSNQPKAEMPEAIRKGKYADPKTSGLKATIKSGKNILEPFNLTATGGAAPVIMTVPGDR